MILARNAFFESAAESGVRAASAARWASERTSFATTLNYSDSLAFDS
jgi:hypothetical protein